nr:MaoC family dehydratase [Rhodococcus sp. KBW08]
MVRRFNSAADLWCANGDELGTSEWVSVSQEMVDQFAKATGDHQWIHVDVDRANRESPFGATIAHGYLSLSLVPALAAQIFVVSGARFLLNYGSNKIRYITPVPVGAQVRLHSTLTAVEEKRGGVLHIVVRHELEVGDLRKVAMVAETITHAVF